MTIEAATCGMMYWRMFRARARRNMVESDNKNQFFVKANALEASVKERLERAQNSGRSANLSSVQAFK